MDSDNSAIKDDDKAKKDEDAPLSAKEEISDFFKTALIAVLLALVIRTFLFEPFNIPSGSMKPTLLVGDYLFVNKPAYGYSRFSFPFGFAPLEGRIWDEEPERGDVLVFKLPTNTYTDYIKRVIGMPGDTIQVRKGRLYINGERIEREAVGLRELEEENGTRSSVMEYIETLPNGVVHSIYESDDYQPLDNTPPYTVPEGHYFMMGDNRDHSQDSRVMHVVGFVPYENIVGRADFLFFSTNGSAGLFEIWKWPKTVRYERLLKDIDPVRLDPPAQ
ncbi:MAG: signal peptidase I [Micavibrio sp.]|nr:signal peptidase I [Micavibrio sp.]